jgi:deoxyhypusine monooxygenase
MAELREVDPSVVAVLREKLAHQSTTLPEKYRILFSLRNIAGKDAHDAMLLGK